MARQPLPPPSINSHARKRPGAGSHALTAIVIGVAGILVWMLAGQRLLRFATGQDIVDEIIRDPSAESQETVPSYLPVEQAAVFEEGAVIERAAEPITDVPDRVRRQVVRYEVQSGDSIFGLAEKFSLDPNTIFWANTDTLQDNVHLIEIGQPLYVLPADGVYHLASGSQTIADMAAEFGVAPRTILNSTLNSFPADADENYTPQTGQRLVIEGGTRDFISWSSPIILTGTDNATSPEAQYHPGSCRNFYTGLGGTGDFTNPLGNISYRVTTSFYNWHPAIDMSANPGTPVYAADAGVVVFAGWHREGYGNLVILDHGNGFTTYYAHMNARFVECGESIQSNKKIGEVGSSGASSGAHLHFEVRKEHIPHTPYIYVDVVDSRTGS